MFWRRRYLNQLPQKIEGACRGDLYLSVGTAANWLIGGEMNQPVVSSSTGQHVRVAF